MSAMPQTDPPYPDLPHEAIAPIAQMLDALQCGASLIDRDGRIVFINERLCELMGRRREDLIGTHVADQYQSPQMLERVSRMLERFDESSEAETYLQRPDGKQVPVISAARPLSAEVAGIPLRVVTITDITPLREAMNDITELSDTVLKQAVDLKHQADALEEKVRERTRELHSANMDAIYMLAVASEAKDDDTGAHVQRIQRYAEAVALEMGIPKRQADRIGYSAILHDVGKIHVPDSILKKPGKLTDEERRQMQRHTIVGETILANQPFFDVARQIARSHHENYDGSGYPDGLDGDDIPLGARIVHVVDVFDALSSERVYKKAWPTDKCVQLIGDNREKDFDPACVDAFLTLFESGRFEQLRPGSGPCDGRAGEGVIDSNGS